MTRPAAHRTRTARRIADRATRAASLAALLLACLTPHARADRCSFQAAGDREAGRAGDLDARHADASLEADVIIRLHGPEALRDSVGLRGAAGLVAGEDALRALDRAWAELLEGLGVKDAWARGELLAGPLTIAIDRAVSPEPGGDERANPDRPAAWRWAAIAPLHDGSVDIVRARMRGKVRGAVAGRARFSMEGGRYQTTGVRADDGTAALIVASSEGDGDLFTRAVRWADEQRAFGEIADGSRVTLRLRTKRGDVRLIASEADGGWVARLIAPADALGLRAALAHTWTGAEAEARLGGANTALSAIGSADLLTGLVRLPMLLRRGPAEARAERAALGLEGGRFACVLRPEGDLLSLTFRAECPRRTPRDGSRCAEADAAAAIVLRTLGADPGASRLAGRMPEVVRRQCVDLGEGSLARSAFGSKAVLRWGAVERRGDRGRGSGTGADRRAAWWAMAAHPADAASPARAFEDKPGGEGPGFVRAAARDREAPRVLSMGSFRPGLMPAKLRAWFGIDADGWLGERGIVTWRITADERARVRAEIVIEPDRSGAPERSGGADAP